MLELYHFHGATCGLKARLALAKKGVDYRAHAVERPYLRTPEYLKLNPNGVVPTLIHDGHVIVESSVVINYVGDAFDGAPLKPEGLLGTARTWWWLKRADECVPMIGTLTYTVSMRPKILLKSPEELEAYIEGTPNAALRDRRRRNIGMGFESPDFPVAMEGLDKMLANMEAALTADDWLASAAYSLADTAMRPLIERLDELACADMWRLARARLAAWWDRIRARPSYEACVGVTPNPEKSQHRDEGAKAWPEIKRLLP